MKTLLDKVQASYVGAALLVAIGVADLFHFNKLGTSTDITFIIIGIGGFGLDLKALPPKV